MGQRSSEVARDSRQRAESHALLPDSEDGQHTLAAKPDLALENGNASTPETLRTRIEMTRAEMAGTVDAIQDKLDPAHIKRQVRDSIQAATLGRVEPGLEAAREKIEQIQELAGTVSEKATAFAGTTGQHTQQAIAGMREHALETARTAASRLGHSESASPTQRQMPFAEEGTSMAGDSAPVGRQVWEFALRWGAAGKQRAIPVANTLGSAIRAYPVAACVLSLGAGLALGEVAARMQRPSDRVAAGS